MAREQEFNIDEATLKPDLIIRLYIVDVFLPYKKGPSLVKAALRKEEKYQPLLPTLQAQLKTSSGEVIQVVIGALPQGTVTGHKKLSFADKKNLIGLWLAAIQSSTDIVRATWTTVKTRRRRWKKEEGRSEQQ